MKISAELFGTLPDGREVFSYVLENNEIKVEILNYGGVIRSLVVPDRAGNPADVVLGFDTLEYYLDNKPHLGVAVGRNSNRISGARLQISGETLALEANDNGNNLHSGANGLAHRLFSSEVHTFNNLPALLLSHTIEDGGDGFPGSLIVTIAYALTEDNALMIDYRAVSDKDTVINLTNHSYFNLAGHDSGNIYGHSLELGARFFTPNRPDCVPTGEILSVTGTPFDFTAAKALGKDIHSAHSQIHSFGGYDHNFVLDGAGYRKIAAVTEPASGRVMTVLTDLPGVQLYTGNGLEAEGGKNGAKYTSHFFNC